MIDGGFGADHMPLGEGNGIHIKKDFRLERGELEVAASRSRSSGHLLSEGMQMTTFQERKGDRTYRSTH